MKTSPQQPAGTQFTPGWSGFTEDWFTHRIQFWQKHIVPVYKDRQVRWLEIGSFEGRSATWTVANILTHPDSTITCVDPWTRAEVKARFEANIAAVEFQKVDVYHGYSQDVLPTLVRGYDVVYVDGDHQAKSCMTDAVLAWRLLKKGGHMIFDDYRWNFQNEHDRRTKTPACKAVDAFLLFWQDELEVIHKDYQVIIRKK